MANRRFIDFPIASTSSDTDIILIWQDGLNKQTTKATLLSGLPEDLEDLNDVVISGLTNGQILRYNSTTGVWENTDQGNLNLNDLNDVTIVSPSNGQVLVYNSSTSKWENSSGGYVPYVGAVTTVDLGAQGLRAGYVRFDTTVASVPNEQGLMFWDADDETVDVVLNGYTMKIGEDLFYPVKNQTGSTIAKGVAVRFNGTVGASGRLLIAPFIANGTVPSSRFMGVTAEEILNGEDGKVLFFGRIRGINTDAFNEGDILYASTTVAGGYQTAIPLPPNNIVQVAAVISKHVNNGTIFVRPTLGSNINTDEGVKITSVADKNLLQYQSATSLWENKTLAQIIGSDYVPSTRNITINGTTQDLSADRTYNVGTVTSVGLSSATSGVTIGSTPVTTSGTITLTIATASGSQNGLLSSTDWTTFNNKQNALTNPVTGTGTTNYLPKFTGSTTIGNSQIFDTGSEVRIFTTSTDARNFTLGVYGVTWDNTLFEIANEVSVFNKSSADNGDIIGFRTVGLQRGDIRASATSFTISSRTNLIFGSNNTDAMTLFSTGNLLVGTGSDNGARLQVSGTGRFTDTISTTNGTVNMIMSYSTAGVIGTQSNHDLQIRTNNTAKLTITSTGNVGIGTSSPAAKLEISTSSGANALALSGYQVLKWDLSDQLWFGGYESNQWTTLKFATSGSERMRITSGGNVGIGTDTPNTILHTFGTSTTIYDSAAVGGQNTSATLRIQNNSNAANTFAAIDFNTNANRVVNRIVSGHESSTTSGFLAFVTESGAVPAERMRITSGGNVGIGTSSPLGSAAERTIHLSDGGGGYATVYVTNSANTVRSIYGMQSTQNLGIVGTQTNSPFAIYTNDTERMRITSSGQILVNKTTSSAGTWFIQCEGIIASQGTDAGYIYQNRNNSTLYTMYATGGLTYFFNAGNIASINMTTGAYTALSDINKKENFEASQIGLKEVLNLKPTIYSIKNDTKKERHLGFIAQEVKQYIPNAYVESDGFIGLNEMPIIAALTKAIQELKQEIDTLKN